jgi:hypothetical protein|tara:strand:- start:935 stop:1144 length:210 start_codon:yes stop_codon:yes gene_type:complete
MKLKDQMGYFTKLSNDYIKGLAILSKMKEEGARPHDYLKHSIQFFRFKEYVIKTINEYEKGEKNERNEN